jgi:hypothetical protein
MEGLFQNYFGSKIYSMSTRHTNWILQWGNQVGRLPQLGYPRSTSWTVTFHYPPGTPLWGVVKGEAFLNGWGGRTPRVGVRRARWLTRGVAGVPTTGGTTRWAAAGGVGPTGWTALTRGPAWVFRPPGFDYTRWGHPLRGTHPGGWGSLLGGEDHLIRPKYV